MESEELNMNKFQQFYFIVFMIMSIGIAGSFDTNTPIPKILWIIYLPFFILSMGKVIYIIRREFDLNG